jgi:hypothetical protein
MSPARTAEGPRPPCAVHRTASYPFRRNPSHKPAPRPRSRSTTQTLNAFTGSPFSAVHQQMLRTSPATHEVILPVFAIWQILGTEFQKKRIIPARFPPKGWSSSRSRPLSPRTRPPAGTPHSPTAAQTGKPFFRPLLQAISSHCPPRGPGCSADKRPGEAAHLVSRPLPSQDVRAAPEDQSASSGEWTSIMCPLEASCPRHAPFSRRIVPRTDPKPGSLDRSAPGPDTPGPRPRCPRSPPGPSAEPVLGCSPRVPRGSLTSTSSFESRIRDVPVQAKAATEKKPWP